MTNWPQQSTEALTRFFGPAGSPACTAGSVAAASGSACRFFFTHRRLPGTTFGRRPDAGASTPW